MVSAKDLRDLFEDIRSEASKRAAEVVSEARIPEIGRRSEPPGIVWLGLGLVLGAVVGMAIALVAAPYPGEETRRRLGQRVDRIEPVDRIKRQGEEKIEQIRTGEQGRSGDGDVSAYPTPTSAYERS